MTDAAHTIIIGAMTPPSSKSPFSRGRLVVAGSMPRDDWNALLGTEQATGRTVELSRPVDGLAWWVMRPSMSRREAVLHELVASGALVWYEYVAEDGCHCIVDEAKAGPLREKWCEEAVRAAAAHAQAERWDDALGELYQAIALVPPNGPKMREVLTMMAAVCKSLGRDTRAAGLITMRDRMPCGGETT